MPLYVSSTAMHCTRQPADESGAEEHHVATARLAEAGGGALERGTEAMAAICAERGCGFAPSAF